MITLPLQEDKLWIRCRNRRGDELWIRSRNRRCSDVVVGAVMLILNLSILSDLKDSRSVCTFRSTGF